MLLRAVRRYLHVAGTAWFVACMVFVLVVSLRQANVRWAVLFPLAGPGAMALFVLISIYLFAIFRGISGSNKLADEHPITSTRYYKAFYVTTPFWGSLAGCLATTEFRPISGFFLTLAFGSLLMTFLVWVVVDPAIGLLETLVFPSARRALRRRKAQERHASRARRQQRETLLQEVVEHRREQADRLRALIEPKATRLAELLSAAGSCDPKDVERRIIALGLEAWQIGGKEGMRILYDMLMDRCRRMGDVQRIPSDLIPSLWDGIGSWRTVQPA